ncbi:hypothetical protein VNO80_19103 [Phaseolus coccineus]|uniref:Uncharacterized protein n=1 Tax=Phaseolus coccineus TaxID=3886 RepID=A0AAN9MFU0_PHACN
MNTALTLRHHHRRVPSLILSVVAPPPSSGARTKSIPPPHCLGSRRRRQSPSSPPSSVPVSPSAASALPPAAGSTSPSPPSPPFLQAIRRSLSNISSPPPSPTASPTGRTFMIFFLAFSLTLRVTLGGTKCENLSHETCSFAVSSGGKRCVLEKRVKRSGEEAYACKTSNIEAENLKDHVETDQCIKACGLDRKSLGILSNSLLESTFTHKHHSSHSSHSSCHQPSFSSLRSARHHDQRHSQSLLLLPLYSPKPFPCHSALTFSPLPPTASPTQTTAAQTCFLSVTRFSARKRLI